MKKVSYQPSFLSWYASILILIIFCMVGSSCKKNVDATSPIGDSQLLSSSTHLKDFTQVNLLADVAGFNAARIDPNFVNAWGITFVPGGPIWINTNETGLSFILRTDGSQVFPAVTIPSPTANTGGAPTGIVFNASSDFVLPNAKPARFIFDGNDGVISGWNGGSSAVRILDRSSNSSYTGLAIAMDGKDNFLYAANFKLGKIEVFDKNFSQVFTKPFMDPRLPAKYSPFNIQNIEGNLYVMYAKVGPTGDEEHHVGFGFVDVYSPDGILIRRLASRGLLNAPWGVAKAQPVFFEENEPREAEEGSGTILVGNFGDGRINAYTPSGRFLGQLRAEHGKPLQIEGLWGLGFSPNVPGSDPNKLFFAAGPGGEKHGLFGYIRRD